MPVVKICGISNLPDAEKCVELGADFLGFIFAESPRKIEHAEARQIRRKLGDTSKLVGVFKDQDAQFVNDTADTLRLDFVQLHGGESPEYCRQINHPIIKAIELMPECNSLPENLDEYGVHAFLFDRPKGQSQNENWLTQIINEYAEKLKRWRPYFIAGGLNAENLPTALKLDPYGIDTASGVEASAGIKDHKKLEAFFQAAKGSTIC